MREHLRRVAVSHSSLLFTLSSPLPYIPFPTDYAPLQPVEQLRNILLRHLLQRQVQLRTDLVG
ncbi:MAG: hypothetical protein OXJ55_07555 [Caldilineaceae bacterium]|nr:hypothetical protein [Caldilineaceae bacterium]